MQAKLRLDRNAQSQVEIKRVEDGANQRKENQDALARTQEKLEAREAEVDKWQEMYWKLYVEKAKADLDNAHLREENANLKDHSAP